MSLHIETCGQGQDLFLLHGWAMHSGIWHDVRSRLAERFCVHMVDLPGHGYSPACGAATFEQITGMIASRLTPECIVCGWSLGGQIAMALALREPGLVRKLALVASSPSFVKRTDWQWGMDRVTLELFMESFRRDYKLTLKRFLLLQVTGSDESREVLARLRQSVFQRNEPDSQGLQAGLEILLTADLRDTIHRITQPVMLIHGENDVIADPDAARWMQQHLPDARLMLLPGCGHAPFLSHADSFLKGLYELQSYH